MPGCPDPRNLVRADDREAHDVLAAAPDEPRLALAGPSSEEAVVGGHEEGSVDGIDPEAVDVAASAPLSGGLPGAGVPTTRIDHEGDKDGRERREPERGRDGITAELSAPLVLLPALGAFPAAFLPRHRPKR